MRKKRKLTAAQRRARRERRKKLRMIFINGRQKRVPREVLVEGVPVDAFIRANADPIWLHQNELWELMPDSDDRIGISREVEGDRADDGTSA